MAQTGPGHVFEGSRHRKRWLGEYIINNLLGAIIPDLKKNIIYVSFGMDFGAKWHYSRIHLGAGGVTGTVLGGALDFIAFSWWPGVPANLKYLAIGWGIDWQGP